MKTRLASSVLALFVIAIPHRDSRELAVPDAMPLSSDKVTTVVAVGDISCDPASSRYNQGRGTKGQCHMLATSDLAISMKPDAVLLLGDNQYENGALEAYKKAWVHSWGRSELKEITHPATGNHEYNTPGASGYFDFFGDKAGERGKGYYSFNLGTWHVVALNTGSNDYCKPLSCDGGSEQEKWLREDLAKNTSSCTLAYWHRPLFTSGLHRGAVETRSFWNDLYRARADLILNGHSHQYERFDAQDPNGASDPDRGIVQFVVGTGGKNLKGFWWRKKNSAMRISDSFGVLKLELRQKDYSWAFVSEEGKVLDRGTEQCHPKGEAIDAKQGVP